MYPLNKACRTGPPRPVMNFSGWSDDLFFVDETIDRKLSVLSIVSFLVLSLVHVSLLVSHAERQSRYGRQVLNIIQSSLIIGFCVLRFIPFILRLQWPNASDYEYSYSTNSEAFFLQMDRFYFAHEILVNGTSILPTIATHILTRRIVLLVNPCWYCKHAKFYLFMIVWYLIVLALAMILFVVGVTAPFLGIDINGDSFPHETGRNLQKFAATWLTVIAFVPIIIMAVDVSVLPQTVDGVARPELNKGQHRTRNRTMMVIVLSASLFTIVAGFRTAVMFASNICEIYESKPWFLWQVCFWLPFVLEVIAVAALAVPGIASAFSKNKKTAAPKGLDEKGAEMSLGVRDDDDEQNSDLLRQGTPLWERRLQQKRSLERERSEGI